MGCGVGVYGYLCRIYLDLYGDDENFLKKLKSLIPWEIKIDAIEGFKDYLQFIPRWAYDDIMVGPAMVALPKIPQKKYDLVLALAILEHFSKEDGILFLDELRRIGRKIILSVPKEWNAQVVPENEFETHRSHWTGTELLSWGFKRILPSPYSWIAVFDDAKPLVLKRFGPEDIRAGRIFNKQPNGESAIWAETENVTANTILVLNGVHLKSAVHPDGKTASAFVPKGLYKRPGDYTIYLLDTITNNKSNEMTLTVKPF